MPGNTLKRRCIWLFVGGLTLLPGFAAVAADELVVYSGRSDKFVKPVVEAFSAKTGIKVVLHTAESTALLNKLRLEGAKTPADVFISNDAGNLQVGSDMGLFKPLPKEIGDVIPANYRAADNSWIGLSARARVLVVNKNNADAMAIKSVWDIADPKWKGKLGVTSATNESFIAGMTVYLQSWGEAKTKQWLAGIKDNAEGRVFSKHSAIVSDVAAGKLAVGLVNHYYIFRHLAEHPDAPVAILLPDQGEGAMGVAWNVAGAAVPKNSAKAEQAQQLMAFFVSAEGQRMFAEANSEYPTREGVPAADEVPAAGSYRVAPVPMAELGKQRNATVDLIESAGMP